MSKVDALHKSIGYKYF